MKLRIWIWTFGLGFVGYALGARAGPNPVRETVGAILGAVVGFCVGWGLQRLFEMGRRH
jgi:predicted permease